MIELYLIRHAQASLVAEDYDDLSSLGTEQSRVLGAYFDAQGIAFDACVTGEMRRHHQTVDAMLETMAAGAGNIGPQSRHPGLNEYDFRAMIRRFQMLYPDDETLRVLEEGVLRRRAYFRLMRRVLTAWAEDRLDGIPESFADFRQRVDAAADYLQSLGRQAAVAGDVRVIAVSSGGAISALIGRVLGLDGERIFDLNMQVRNTAVTRLIAGRRGFRLAEFNALPHLSEQRRAGLVTYA